MYDHIGLKVKDLDVAVRFYSAALAPLGHVLATKEPTYAGIGPKGEPGLWLYAAKNAGGPGVHIALRAPDRAAVDNFTPRASRQAVATMAPPACGSTTARTTTPPS